jgi:hypothetical protein
MIKRATRGKGSLARGFVTGWAQATSVIGLHATRPFPTTQRTAAQALGDDWEKLGGDMRRAMAKATSAGER